MRNPFDEKELTKTADAAYAVEGYLLNIAKSRDVDVCELVMAIMALLIKRMNDSNGVDMAKGILDGLSEVVEKMGAAK
jgi:hypothetical protein